MIDILGHQFTKHEGLGRANLRCEICNLVVYDCCVERMIYDNTSYKNRIVYMADKINQKWSDVDISCNEVIIKRLLE